MTSSEWGLGKTVVWPWRMVVVVLLEMAICGKGFCEISYSFPT
jgi:hypothetical protein